MASLLIDLRRAALRLRATPPFTLPVVATLTLGIGVVVAVFALVDAVLLRPLPYPNADRLVALRHAASRTQLPMNGVSIGTLAHYSAHNRTLEAAGGYMQRVYTVTAPGEPAHVQMAIVSPGFFSILGITPIVGRFPAPSDDDPATGDEVLISHDLWIERFGGAADVVGQNIEIERILHTVVGVAPPGFNFPSGEVRLWGVWSASWWASGATYASLRALAFNGIARLRPGFSVEDAERDLNRLIATLPDAFPDVTAAQLEEMGLRARVIPFKEEVVGNVRAPLLMLLATAAFLLLITWANATNLCLVRAERLRREAAIERALGASAGILARRYVIEGLLLAVPAGALGFGLATLAINARFGFSATEIPRLDQVGVNGAVIGVTAALTLVSAAIVTAALLVSASPSSLVAVRSGALSRITSGRREQTGRRILVAGQVAMALTLLIGAALMARSFWRLKRVELGFRPEGVLTFHLPVPPNAYGDYHRSARVHAEVLSRLRALPGIEAAEAGNVAIFPLKPVPEHFRARIAATGRGEEPRGGWPYALFGFATPDYFRVMGIPIIRGRSFRPEDTSRERPGVILSASLARELFGTDDPIGRQVQWAAEPEFPAYTVVGVVGDVPAISLREGPTPAMYLPNLYPPMADTVTGVIHVYIPFEEVYVLRTKLPASAIMPAVLRAIREVDPKLLVTRVATLEAVVADSTSRARLVMVLLSVGAGTALVLGVIGLYGVLSYSVRQRSTELGVRLALGATPADVVRIVVRQGAVLALAGIGLGVLASAALTRALRSMLFEVSPGDPLAFVGMAALLFVVALAASYLPARRAGRIDPVHVLKAE